MDKLVIDRKAADNKYLHKDFHLSTDLSLDYVADHFGEEGIKEYLSTYSTAYYVPLVAKIKKEGLSALKDYFISIYEIEEASDAISASLDGDRLDIVTTYSPAVMHMLKRDHTPSKWYIETTRTVYGTIAANAGLDFSLEAYDAKTGAAKFHFVKK